MKHVTQGLRMWVIQRLTAVYMALFTVFILGYLMSGESLDFQRWRLFMGSPMTMTAWSLFFLSLLLHVWVGMRDAILDYVQTFAIKIFVLAVLALGLVSMAIWALRVLLMAGN
jgi:succinate dehydrogenase / fumarate reductase membrane anchor subunit